ncbi:hypothetical protein CK203_045361 [Vitis vinifera]|uniref:Zinc finger PMZ-type domain-containing protein n=1 Tax=Vitis vinifera TaxID=29760 RepID=A0A438H9B0_VITVI|nr:hypothetical protein CK203_045361 [Vitis vinifera]
MEEEMFCYIHEGGELVKTAVGSVEYKGGRTNCSVVSKNISQSEFVSKVCGVLNLDSNSIKLEFTVKFDPSCLLPLHNDGDIVNMFKFNDMFCHVYISHCTECGDDFIALLVAQPPLLLQTQLMFPLLASPHYTSLMSRPQFSSGHTFPNASEFRDAIYLMSLAGKFRYSYKRNSPKHMTVVCTIEDCPWKITARAIGDSNIVQVHTFRNVHNHCLEDVVLSQPLVRSTRASLVIDDVIRSTPEYQPRQICKDFVRQHGIQLTYLQAWQMKEKAKERIYGQPKNYYKLLPWMCERMLATNPGSSVELSYSNDDHFEKLFVAHSISIEGFVRGCRPIIAIDSAHMSGPYGGALFSATSYDANDSMFLLAFGVMSSENYEDWLWFLEKLKIVVGNKEVIIISDRHHALLRSVPEVFGIENHAYCYRHLKENFSSFLSKHNTRGNKGKENALQFLDSIAYGRLEHDYNVSMVELKKYNEALATWVEENAPHHWAMSKFPKQRWDKMTTNLAESFNAWLRIERHHSICNFLLEHMSKLASMLVKHQEESKNWKGCIGPKIEAKVQENIAKGAVYPVTPFKNGVFGVCIGRALLNVDILNHTCTCRGWQMLGISYEHATAVIISIGQNVTDFVDDCYKYPMQELIYGGSFSGIETHDMPTVDDDGLVRSITGEVFFSLKPPHTKRPPGRPRKKRIESQFQDKRPVYCSRCHMSGHNRKTCKNPLP